ncbi:MAG: right-handed parallel beta-helix repeat-containing protein [Ignavibacteriales bacterium]|nr:right-handed parallel beta-helix repeat-containing protein [Ignavibacteriales bacterium]
MRALRTRFATGVILISLFVNSTDLFSQTVSGPITSDTTWTLANSPMTVTGTVTVSSGVALTIEPGVVVKFNSVTSLLVAGKIVASGTGANPITFTSSAGSPTPGDWNGIEFQNTANVGSVFNDCIVEYAGGGASASGVFYVTGAFSINITNSTFRFNANHGINARASSPRIASSTFRDNTGYGIYSDLLSNFIVDSCVVSNNTSGGIRIPVNSTPQIQYCAIDSNGTGIVVDNNAIPVIRYNNIRNNSTGIQFTGVGSTQPTISNNTITGNTSWGFRNTSTTTTVKAENNYWGSDLGPFHPSLNDKGLGDRVSDFVDFQPWTTLAVALPVKLVSATISVNTTWYADTVYRLTTNVTVNGGITLTVNPGTIVKFGPSDRLTISGTIIADGKPDSLIVFTSEKDDPYGGDSNGDLASSGVPGDWDMLWLNAGGNGSSVLDNCLFRFGGSSGNGNLRIDNSTPTVSEVSSAQSSNYGMFLNSNANVTVSNSVFGSNGNDGVLIYSSNPSFYGSKFVNNGRYGIYAASGSPHFSVRKCEFTGNSYGIVADAGSAGATLVSLDSSVVSNNVNGGLYLWYGTGPQTFSYNRISNNGAYGLWCYNVDDLVTIEGDTIINNGNDGIITSRAVISNNVIQGNRYPIALIGRVNTTYSGNTIAGNQYNNAIALRMNRENLSDTLKTTFPAGMTSGTYVLIENSTGVGVAAGQTLVIQPGVIFKIDAGTYFRVDGTLIAEGTSTNPIVFTSYRDASYGGKTNAISDNAAPAPGNWRYVRIRPGAGAGSSVIRNCIFKYGGTDGVGNLWIESSGTLTYAVDSITVRRSSSMGVRVGNVLMTISNSTIDSNATYGMYIEGSSPRSDVTVKYSFIKNNGSTALQAADNSTYREVSNCTITSNNGYGIAISNGTIPQVFFGNTISFNNGHGIYTNSPSIAATDLQFIGNNITDNTAEGVFSTAARFVDNQIRRNRYPLGVLGRLGNIYVDNAGVDGNVIAENQFNNAIALAGSNYAPLRDTLKNVFPQAITSKTYVVIENIQVSGGDTLAIQPGVNIKFQLFAPNYNDYKAFNVYGTLLAQGTPADPIVFTSWRDSTAGGKTTLPTDFVIPRPGDWYYFAFRNGSGGSVVRHCQFKYGGQYGSEALYFEQNLGAMIFSNNLVRRSASDGIYLNNTAAVVDSTTVDSCAYNGIRVVGNALNNLTLRNSSLRANNQYGLRVDDGGKVSLITNCDISRNGYSGVYVANNSVPLSIIGNTVNNNNDHGLYVLALNDAVDTLLIIAGNKVHDNGLVGIFSSRAYVIDDSVTGNRAAIGVTGQISLDGSTNVSGNVYEGNYTEGNVYDGILIAEENVYGRLGLSFPDGYSSKVVAVRGGLLVPSGSTLTIAPGTILKFAKEYTGGAAGTWRFLVNGVLKSEGTLNNKIVFTSWRDDSYGGDSNKDSNATVPGNGDWDMIYLNGASNNASHILHTIIRFGGYSGIGNIYQVSNTAAIDSSFISYTSNYGIYLSNSSPNITANEIHHTSTGIYATGNSNPVIQRNNFHDNSSAGLNNGTTNTLDATNNYWGDASGPLKTTGSPTNVGGLGNRIVLGSSGDVTFIPYLTSRSGILLGDVSENGTITAFDGSLVLRHTVNLDTLVGNKALAADVSADGTISAFDASLILRYVVGLISGFPGLGKRAADADIASSYELKLESGRTSDEVALVLYLNGTSRIFATELHVTFDASQLSAVEFRKSSLADNTESIQNFTSGRAHAAIALTEPVTESGELFRLIFKVGEDAQTLSEGSFTIEKFVLNETDLTSGTTGGTIEERATPTVFGLEQNYPNPFNPSTSIEYQLPTQSNVVIKIYNILGQQVKELLNRELNPGYHTVSWNGTDASGKHVASGLYLYRIVATYGDHSTFTMVKKMMLLK